MKCENGRKIADSVIIALWDFRILKVDSHSKLPP